MCDNYFLQMSGLKLAKNNNYQNSAQSWAYGGEEKWP